MKEGTSSYPIGVSATFGANDGKISMLEQGIGYTYYYSYYYSSRFENNPTSTQALRFSNGKSYSIKITVKNEKGLPRITAYVGGKKFMSWKGNPSALSGSYYSSSRAGRNTKAIGLAVYNSQKRSSVIFRSGSIQMLSGTLKKVHD